MDAQATWYQRMFPWLFKVKKAPRPNAEQHDEPYYEVWFDGTNGDHYWWYAVYDAKGKRLKRDYWFSERQAIRRAKEHLNQIKAAEEAKRQGKTEPTRYYA